MKIVAEYEICESEVEVVEEEKQLWHYTYTHGWNGCGCVVCYSPRVLGFVGVAIA